MIETQKAKVPFMIVIGDQEMEEETLSIRAYGEQKSQSMSQSDALDLFLQLDAQKEPAELREQDA